MAVRPGTDDIIYGSPQQVAVVRRANALYRLVGHDPRFTFQGRTVSCLGDSLDAADLVIDLCRLQGYSSAQFVPRDQAGFFLEAYKRAGLSPVEWEQYWGHDTALTASAAFMKEFQIPRGLTLREVTPDTPDDRIHAICRMSQTAGVLPAPGSALRGYGPRGIILYAETEAGDIASVGGGFMAYHPDSAWPNEAFWGMLATAQDWRGKRLACWVGAAAILALADRFGARGFSSGVKADNPSSQAMCSRLGVVRSNRVYAGASDPDLMGSGSVTR